MTMKSHGINNFPTYKGMSSIIPTGYLIDLSTSCNEMVVGFKSPTWSFLQMEYGMRLALAPRSHSALLMETSLTEQGIKKLSGSRSLGGSLF